MKKLFALLLMLLALVTVAYADLTPPLDANGEPIVINTLMPYGEGLLIHYHHGETIYLSDMDDNWHAYPTHWENADARNAAVAARIEAMEALGLDSVHAANDFYAFASVGSDLLAVGQYTGTLYQVTFEDGHAVMTYLTMLDILPEKDAHGYLRIDSVLTEAGNLYLLTVIDDNGKINANRLYAFDRKNWSRRDIAVDIPTSSYMNSAALWQDGTILVDTATQGNHDASGAYVIDPNTGKTQTLKEYFGTFTLPGGYVYASSAERGIVIFREITDNLMYSVSAEKGVIAFTRRKDIGEQFVFHPDGRALQVGKTFAEVADPLQAMPITKLNVLTGGSSAPSIQMNSNIPDIQLVTFERFATEETEIDAFANAMTTQSSQYDIFILPIMQAESIIRKGYCVPMTSESAQIFVADMYPHMADQLTNENGELVMVPVQLQRRNTIAYDTRAAELLGIDPADMPTTYEELFEFMRNFEYDYGDLALEYDISLFDSSTARNIGTLRQRMMEDAIALSRVDRKALQANAKEIGALLDDTLKLSKEVSDVVSPYFYIPEIMFSDSTQPPEHLEEPAFLFTLNTSALPSDHVDTHYHYLRFTQPFELALTEDIAPTAIYYGHIMVINPYSTNQNAALRYMDYVLNNMNGKVAANVLTTAKPVESMYMDTWEMCTTNIAKYENDPEFADYVAMLRELGAGMDQFIYDIPQSYLDTYQASVEITQPVWLDVKEAFAPCNAAWEQFLRGSIDGQQLLKRVLEVSQMIELE